MKIRYNFTDLSTFLDSGTMIYHKNVRYPVPFGKELVARIIILIQKYQGINKEKYFPKTYFSICNERALKISFTDTHPYESRQSICKGKSETIVRIISIA